MLNNIKTVQKDRGFTIVELLIVIVVIAILAAITIVAYNGIQTRANNTSAQTAANNVAKKLEAYNAIKSSYPAVGTSITDQLATENDSSLTGSGITLSQNTPTGDARRNTVYVDLCGATAPAASSAASGYKVFRYDFSANAWKSTPDQTGGTTTACASSYTGTSGAVQ